MAILIDNDTVAIVQGATGKQGSYHTRLMVNYGTRIVAGVTPGKGGTEVNGIPIYDTVNEAKQKHLVNASIIFVPAPFAADAAHEALDAGIKIVIIVTEHVPVEDSIGIMAHASEVKAIVIGPNTPGIITPGKSKLGIMPEHVFTEGNIGLVSRSGTLTYEIAAHLSRNEFGQSTCLGVGGDPVTGIDFIETLKLFKNDSQTDGVVLIGEIGGEMEELAAEYIYESGFQKPIVVYVAGRFAPVGKRMGHAGAIVLGKAGTVESKVKGFLNVGVSVAQKPGDVGMLLYKSLKR